MRLRAGELQISSGISTSQWTGRPRVGLAVEQHHAGAVVLEVAEALAGDLDALLPATRSSLTGVCGNGSRTSQKRRMKASRW